MSESEIRDRLTRIETLLEEFLKKYKEENEDTTRRRVKCGERLDTIETYIDVKTATDKVKAESAISKSALSSMADIAKTVATVITVMIAMKILHF